jgi:hypothetical protein
MIGNATSWSWGRFVEHDATPRNMGVLWEYLEMNGRMAHSPIASKPTRRLGFWQPPQVRPRLRRCEHTMKIPSGSSKRELSTLARHQRQRGLHLVETASHTNRETKKRAVGLIAGNGAKLGTLPIAR